MTPVDSGTPISDERLMELIEEENKAEQYWSDEDQTYSFMSARDRSKALRELQSARRELSAVQRDAERYRWLFEDNGNGVMDRVNRVWRQWNGLFKDWDAAVDAAIKESGKSEKCQNTGVPVQFCTCVRCMKARTG